MTTPRSLADERDDRAGRREAAVGRVTAGILSVAVLAAALGACGGAGPLVRAEAEAGGLGVAFDQFARLDAPTRLDIRLPAGADALTLEGDLADGLRVDAVSPSPSAEASTAAGVRLEVDAAGGPVTLHARPVRFGVLTGAVSAGGDRVGVRVVVYP